MTITIFSCSMHPMSRSYVMARQSMMNIANSLMLDFRCLVVPRFGYATGDAFGNDRTEDMYVADIGILERLEELTDMAVKLADAVEPEIESLPKWKGRT